MNTPALCKIQRKCKSVTFVSCKISPNKVLCYYNLPSWKKATVGIIGKKPEVASTKILFLWKHLINPKSTIMCSITTSEHCLWSISHVPHHPGYIPARQMFLRSMGTWATWARALKLPGLLLSSTVVHVHIRASLEGEDRFIPWMPNREHITVLQKALIYSFEEYLPRVYLMLDIELGLKTQLQKRQM